MTKSVVIAEYDNRMQAEISARLLDSFGIKSRVSSDDLAGLGPGQSFVRGVQLLVSEDEADKALQVLAGTDDE